MGVGSEKKGPWRLWIFIHGTAVVDRGLIRTVFRTVFRCPSPKRPCLGTRLFIKIPRPGYSEVGTFSVFE